MVTLPSLTERHNLIGETKFHFKSFLHIVHRQLLNAFFHAPKFHDGGLLKNQPVISSSESNLWNPDDNPENWILTAGKIENLRIAIKCLNGIEISPNKIFSFWRHIGNPNLGKGYVVGREVREGCIIPTIAGGLCQLSNALYDAALKAGFEIIERHKHTKVIKGSLAEQDRDATVKWNYVDLRFKSSIPFRIEIEISADKLIVQFRSPGKVTGTENKSKAILAFSKLNDCYSCGNFACFKHPDRSLSKPERAITTFILDERWEEYDNYIQTIGTDKDFFILPFHQNRLFSSKRYYWTIKNEGNVATSSLPALQRMVASRVFSKFRANPFSLGLALDKRVAIGLSKHIPVESTHIIVSQNLLAFIWETGVLGGRTFDVLMSRLPMEKLHERLDMAYAKYPESKTLNDFRASQHLIDLENTALTRSRHIITPHQEITDIFNNKSIKLDWSKPKGNGRKLIGKKILFPASALGRKGAYEVRQLAKELDLQIVISGRAEENLDFWNGVQTEMAGVDPFENIGLVVYPTYIEHQPRLLLKAITYGLPIVTTTACGLSPSENVTIVPMGDFDTLKRVVAEKIGTRP